MNKEDITVAVIIPVYQLTLSEYELFSIIRCLSVLRKHEIVAIVPEDLEVQRVNIDLTNVRIERFESKYFKGVDTYNKLMLSQLFYERFKKYTYILIYQLDSLVLVDRLYEWCQKGYDYIGAPWFIGFDREKSDQFLGVGNGGFSLRKVDSFLRVLSSRELHNHNDEIALLKVGYGVKDIVLLKILLILKRRFQKINYLKLFLNFYSSYEDIFWSVYSRFFTEEFKVPSVTEALQFAFEVRPRFCFEQNNNQFPFGCHAWFKHDKDFWLWLLENEPVEKVSIPVRTHSININYHGIKVLHINYSDLNGGAARASYRIHMGLLSLGIDSRMLVIDKVSDDYRVDEVGLLRKLFCKSKNRISRLLLNLQKSQNTILHCLNLFPSGLHKIINESDADIVHLHWVNLEMISIKGIRKIKKPIAWTLHDSWAFCGAEHHPALFNDNRYKDGYNSDNRSKDDRGIDLDKWTWRRKIKHWKNKKFYVVTPSNWLGSLAKESVLFKNNPTQVIHNGLDLDQYKPLDKYHCRKILNLSTNKKLIGFGAISAIADLRKGHGFLLDTLKKLPPNFKNSIELVVIGSSRPKDAIDLGFKTHYLGHLFDNISLVSFYNAIDVFISPSVLENLSSMLVESMACATPCVAFNVGGTSDIITHKQDGYLAKPYEINELAGGIDWVLGYEHYDELCQNSRKKVEEKFDITIVAKQYDKLYKKIFTHGE